MKQRHHFIRPMRYGGFLLREVQDLGFEVSQLLWKTCFDQTERKKGLFKYKIRKLTN